MPPAFARQFLEFRFTPAERALYLQLAEKARLGTLNTDERDEINDLLLANDLFAFVERYTRTPGDDAVPEPGIGRD